MELSPQNIHSEWLAIFYKFINIHNEPLLYILFEVTLNFGLDDPAH